MERRYSAKREAILHCLRMTDTHPTANWVCETLRGRFPDLSLATVYRNLRLFQEEGQIQSVGVFGGLERFDGVAAPHTHFHCRVCGRVLDLPAPAPDCAGLADLAALEGLEVESCALLFRGVCRACKQDAKN